MRKVIWCNFFCDLIIFLEIQFKNTSNLILLSFKVPSKIFFYKIFINRTYFFKNVVLRIAKLSWKLSTYQWDTLYKEGWFIKWFTTVFGSIFYESVLIRNRFWKLDFLQGRSIKRIGSVSRAKLPSHSMSFSSFLPNPASFETRWQIFRTSNL